MVESAGVRKVANQGFEGNHTPTLVKKVKMKKKKYGAEGGYVDFMFRGLPSQLMDLSVTVAQGGIGFNCWLSLSTLDSFVAFIKCKLKAQLQNFTLLFAFV